MNKKALYAFIISFALLTTVIVLNRRAFNDMRNFSKEVDHTREVITLFESLSNNFKSAQIYTKTYDRDTLKNFYRLYKAGADSVGGELVNLKLLVQDNPAQAAIVSDLTRMINNQMGILMEKNIAEVISSGEGGRLDSLFTIHALIDKAIAQEEQLLKTRKASLDKSTYLNNILTTSFAFMGIAMLVTAFLFNFFISRKSIWLEDFLESILNTSQNGIVYYKAVREHGKIVDFKLEFINKAIDHLLGIKSGTLIGKKLSEFPSFIRETNLLDKYIEVIESGKPLEFETLYQRNDIERWFLVSLAKLNDGVTSSFHDISQLKKYEGELKENINNLQRSNLELEQYAYVASHDLQEPLRKIRSFGSFLKDTQGNKLDEKGRQQLDKMLSAAERMSVLIKDILSFSSLKKEGSMDPVDLNGILSSVLQDLDLMITQKKAVIEADHLPVIEAIPLQMTQLFYNLINNSLKFFEEERESRIRITCRKLDESEKTSAMLKNIPYFELLFQDNGIGFSDEYGEQIFGLFKRLNDKQLYPGSGIGLALCKKVVENHHGTIIAKGQENAGASFYVYLPEKQETTSKYEI